MQAGTREDQLVGWQDGIRTPEEADSAARAWEQQGYLTSIVVIWRQGGGVRYKVVIFK